MTSEKMYEMICAMLKDYDAATGNTAAGYVIDRPWELEKISLNQFYANAAAILIDCRAAMDKKTTPAGSLSAIKRFCKAAMASNNRALNGVFEYSGKYCICDGYRMLRLNNDIDSLPHLDTNNTRPINVDQIMEPAIDNCRNEIAELPTAAEIKAYIARCNALYGKRADGISYEVAPGLFVNPHYLLDIIQALPDCRAYIDTLKGWKSSIYFVSDAGDGLLLPINPNYAKVA